MLRNFRSVVDDPVAGCARSAPAPSPPAPRPQHRRPDRPSAIVAPNRNLPTTIPLKRTGDVGQQPQRRPAGPSRSVCVRAHWNRRRLARARGGSESGKRCQIPLIFPIRSGRSAERARESAPLSVLQIFRSVVDDPVAGCARSAPAPSPPAPRPQHRRPDRPSAIVAPNRNLPTTIPLKRTGDVGQQPQRRPAGPSRSVCVRAHWNRRRLARARGGSESGKRCQIPLIFPIRSGRSAERARESAPLSVLQIFRSVVDDPVAGCARSAPAPSPPAPRPQHRRPDRPSAIVAPNRNLPTTIPLKRTGDVGQQPQRRPAGPSRSVCVRAHWNRRRLARARGGSESGKRCQIPLIFPIRSGRSAERARESAPLSVLQIFRSVVDDPVAGCARSAPAPSPPAPRPQHRRPDRPSAIVAPNRNLPTTIPLKRTGDVGQQPQRRPAGPSRSVCVRAHWNRRRLARARGGSESGKRGASQRGFRSGVLAASTPYLHSGRIVVRAGRPRSSVAPNRNITKKESAPPATSPSAASTRCAGPSRSSRHRAAVTATRRILSHHLPRDKEHRLARRKCRRESTT